ncbi:alpha-2B adrenergic receptor [Elysia marginata]|uniref:Alpha-2B adrenergic receptor n=1 Tax=Elysia marginata TaxID=1093978 RepID=A0AAV4EJP4_9GAST|nr:alpha-2B adrenergic receptor [Elysia marginata]
MASTLPQALDVMGESYEPDLIILTYTNYSTFDFEFDFNGSEDTFRNDSLVSTDDSSAKSPWWMSDYPSGYSWPHIICGAIIVTIIILMIIVGNALVIWAITHDRTLKTSQNLFIGSLAFADLLLGLVVIPFSLANELLGYWLFGVVWCELYKAIDVLLCTASIISLCLISLDRYWSITRAVHYARQRTVKRAAVMIFMVWFISAVISIPPLIGWKQQTKQSIWPLCNLSEDIGYVVYSAFGSFFIPAFIMVFVYFKIYQAAKERARKTVKSHPGVSADKAEPKHSTESSITEHPGQRDTINDLYRNRITNGHDHGGVFIGDDSVLETAIESVPATTSEDEAGLRNLARSEQVMSGASKNTEYSKLLPTDSDSADVRQMAVQSLHGDVSEFEAVPTSDTEATPNLSVSDSCSVRNNGSLRRFQIMEVRANGSSTVAKDGDDPQKATMFDSLRRHLLVRARNSRKRKQTPASAEAMGKSLDFQTAERQKRKLAKARERRATVVLGLVMAAFILCWLPFFSLYLASAFCAGCIPGMVFSVFFWIGYCNSALNPIIYTVFNRDFRRAFQKILCGRRTRRH